MSPFFEIGQLVTFSYFFYMFFLLPFIGLIEKLVYYIFQKRFSNSQFICMRGPLFNFIIFNNLVKLNV